MVVAAFDGRVMLCILLANFVGLCVRWPQQSVYGHQISAGERMTACRDCYGHSQMYSEAFLMSFPKTIFSLFCRVFRLCDVATLVST
jgi:hypothetical protein